MEAQEESIPQKKRERDIYYEYKEEVPEQTMKKRIRTEVNTESRCGLVHSPFELLVR